MIVRSILIVSLIFASGIQAEDVYKVIDENGRIQFTQFPPYKGAEKLKIKGIKNGAVGANQESSQSLKERQKRYSDYLQSERLERKEKRIQAKQEKAALISKCNNVRADLYDMNQGGILYYDLDENGERVYIDESRIEAKKNRLRTFLNKQC